MISQEEAVTLLEHGLHALGIDPLPAPRLTQLFAYCTELGKWGRTMNLVAQAPAGEVLENHFLDSLTLLPALADPCGPLLDVGSGAGFPGLVLKIAQPELAVCLLEPRQKRVLFLRHIIRTLKLTGIQVVEGRLHPGDAAFVQAHGQFPLITSRAVTEIGPFLDLVAAVAPPQGLVLCMKGPKADEELAVWREQWPASPFEVERALEFTLPHSGARRRVVVFRKGALTLAEAKRA
jgi:16S rRNA (guanine527-N7)-methyltransferase